MNMRKMIGLFLTALFWVTLSQSGLAQTAGLSRTGGTPQSRRSTYLQLNRKIYARHQDAGSGQLNDSNDSKQLTADQLNKLIGSEIKLALATPGASAASVTASIANLQGDLSLSAYDPRSTNTPFVKFVEVNGVEAAAVAYVIMQGGDAIPDTQPYLVLYDKSSGVWEQKIAAPTPEDFGGCSLSVAQLNPGIPGEAWFLVWGQPFGSSHGSKQVRLYAFDGTTVRTIWRRDSLDGGRITTTPDAVSIYYLDQQDPSIEKHELFRVGPEGLVQQ
jgi:hypothetical protein